MEAAFSQEMEADLYQGMEADFCADLEAVSLRTDHLLEADILQLEAGFLADFAADSSEADFCADLEDAFELIDLDCHQEVEYLAFEAALSSILEAG